MKAIIVRQNGGPEVLNSEVIEIGNPGLGQVLINMKVIGVNFIDIHFRRGSYSTQLPFIPGIEGAGVIEKVGKGVKNVKPGNRVAFVHQPSAYSEKCLVKADKLILLPNDLPFEQAAAFPLQGMTAHYLIHEFCQLKPGNTVLVHAAAGGVGLLLVQWAKHLGLNVIGTVSNDIKAKIAMEAGADNVILYQQKDFATEVKRLTNNYGANLILDSVGKTTFNRNFEAVANRGYIIIFGAASGKANPIIPNSLMKRSLSLCGGNLSSFIADKKEMMRRAMDVLQGVQEGWLKLRIDCILPLSQAVEAHRLIENRQTAGKVLLTAQS